MIYDEIDDLASGVDQAIVAAAGRLADMKLRVGTVELSVKVQFKKKVEGGIDLKIVKVGTGWSSSDTSTITVSFKPKTVVPAAALDDELIDALEVVQRALGQLDGKFEFSSATVEIGLEVAADGKVSVVVGGEASHTVTHVAKLILESVG
jgi:hypothetical protein